MKKKIKETKGKKTNSDTFTISVIAGLAKDAGRKKKEAPKPQSKIQQINTSGKGSKAPNVKFVVKASQDYAAKSARELSFGKGDTINVISTDDATGMWQGECKGKRGIFPSGYVYTI